MASVLRKTEAGLEESELLCWESGSCSSRWRYKFCTVNGI